MKKALLPTGFILTFVVGLWLGFCGGLDFQYRSEATIHSWLLLGIHENLVHSPDELDETIRYVLDTGRSFDTVSRDRMDASLFVSPELVAGLFRNDGVMFQSENKDYLAKWDSQKTQTTQ